MAKKLVKQDQNLLEFPLWILDKKKRDSHKFEMESKEGKFLMEFPSSSPPDSIDGLILLGLLKIAQSKKSKTIQLKRIDLLKLVGFAPTAHYYNRLWTSLKKWKQTTFEFHGAWYDGSKKKRGSQLFGILSYAEYVEDEEAGGKTRNTKTLKVKLDEKFYDLIRDSRYYRLIDLDQYKQLRKPTSRRLFEILIKHLETANKWECEVKKLAEKLTLDEKYPSLILRRLKPATDEIRKNTFLKVSLHSRTTADKRTIASFRRLKSTVNPSKEKQLQQKANQCWKKNYGSCGALWDNYKDYPERECFYCKKFLSQKDSQPTLFPSE